MILYSHSYPYNADATSEIEKIGTAIAVPYSDTPGDYQCVILVFSHGSAPRSGAYTPPWVDIDVFPTWAFGAVGNTADGVPVYGWFHDVGGIVDHNPDKWSDDNLAPGESLAQWTSRHTKKQIEDLEKAKQIIVDLYLQNASQPTLTLHWENGSQHELTFHEKWMPFGEPISSTDRTKAYGAINQFPIGKPIKKEDTYHAVLNDGGSYRTWIDLNDQLWNPLNKAQQGLINKTLLSFNEDPEFYWVVFKATRDINDNGTVKTVSSARIICAVPLNTPSSASDVRYDVRYIQEAGDIDMGFDVKFTVHIDEDIPPKVQDDINLTREDGDPNYDNRNPGKNDGSSVSIEDGAGVDTTGMLTNTYMLTKEQTRILGQKVWNQSYFDVLKIQANPIENIVAVKAFPFSLTGTSSTIFIGNVDMQCTGSKLSTNFHKVDAGKIMIPRHFDNFLDYAPYTTVSVYIPYSGIHSLDTSLVMGQELTFDYLVDLVSGAARCRCKLKDIVINEFDCTMGIDIPLSSTDRAQTDARHLSSIAGGIMFGARAGIVGAASGAASGILNAIGDGYHTSHTSGGSPTVSSHDNNQIFVIVDYPTPVVTDKFRETFGRLCRKNVALDKVSGYTEISNIKLDGIPLTEAEESDLRQILTSGFYI